MLDEILDWFAPASSLLAYIYVSYQFHDINFTWWCTFHISWIDGTLKVIKYYFETIFFIDRTLILFRIITLINTLSRTFSQHPNGGAVLSNGQVSQKWTRSTHTTLEAATGGVL